MYTFEIASILSQFGKTEIDFNLSDEDRIMPNVRVSRSFNNKDFDIKDIDKKGQDICNEYEIIFIEEQNIKQQKESQEIQNKEKFIDVSVTLTEEINNKHIKLTNMIESLKLDSTIKNNLLTNIRDLQVSLLCMLSKDSINLSETKEENIYRIKELSKETINLNIPKFDIETKFEEDIVKDIINIKETKDIINIKK